MRDLDDLFNEFFNFGKKNGFNSINDELMKLIENIINSKNKKSPFSEEEIENSLGEPNLVETRVEDGLEYKKLTWYTKYGNFVKVIVSDVRSNKEEEVKEKSLEEQLKEAVNSENYELAIKLRDQINANKKTKRTRKKNK